MIMRHNLFHTSFALFGLSTLILIGCVENGDITDSRESRVINMDVQLECQNSVGTTRAAETTLATLEQEGNRFMAWGYFSPEAVNAAPGTLYVGDSHTKGTIIGYSGGAWDYTDATKKALWPLEGDPLNFQAVTPYDCGTIVNTPSEYVPCVAMRVTVPTDNTQQKDLLFGHEENVTRDSHNNAVILTFEHAMSQICFKAKKTLASLSVEISGITIHNVRNSATVGYTGPLTASRRALAVSDYGATVGNYSIGMVSPSVAVASSTPVPLNALDGSLMLLPQSGTHAPDAWNTSSSSAVPLTVADKKGAEMSYLQITCKVRRDSYYVIGSEDTFKDIYLPFKADWEIGKKYTYVLDFSSGTGSYGDDGEPTFSSISFQTVVEDWDSETPAIIDVFGDEEEKEQAYARISDLPSVFIETFDGKSITSKEDYKYCRLHYVDEHGTVTDYDSVSIRGRGNSTWGLAKKPYRLKFNNKEKFLGKDGANSKKWNLLANAADKTMIRNALTFALGEFTSLAFNPGTKFADLTINGEYMGTYQITDQIEVKKKRVDITEQPVPPTEGSDISGGYLLEVDGFKDGNYFITKKYSVPVRIRYPDEDDIVSSQNQYIRDYVNSFEATLASSGFTDPESGYKTYVDETSLIDWYLCTEISANYDGFWSIYFYKKQNDPKFYWGPLWDFDKAYDNEYRVKTVMGLESSVHSLISDISTSAARAWAERMWEDPWFRQAVNNRYRELLDAGLVSYMQEKVDSLKNIVYKSQELNYQKWGINKQIYHEKVLYSSYDQYISDLKAFITEHCAYLEQEFANRAKTNV